MDLFSCFDRVVVINLAERKDRRREMERQLKRLGLAREVEFFPAIRPTKVDDWPNLGARGSFLSHYALLRQACDAGLRAIAIMEDDCDFEPCFTRVQEQVARALAAREWGIVYFGHGEPFPEGAAADLRPCTRNFETHFYAVHESALRRVVDYLEAVQARAAGHPQGGPQYIDGAIGMFRVQNPDVPILLACPNLGHQRRSRSDINPRWFDRIPVVRALVGELRRW